MSALSDVWDGIIQGIHGKVSSAEQRITNSTGSTPEQGNTGAAIGMSIVDAIAGRIHGAADAAQKQILESGTGKKLVSQATSNQIAALVGDWRTWAILGTAVLILLYLGGKIRAGGK